MLLTHHLLDLIPLPDAVIRLGIRARLRATLARAGRGDLATRKRAFRDEMAASPIALAVATANEQHYELPTDFFRQVLGRQMKYSSGYWPAGVTTLDEAEAAMLAVSAERAGLADGQRILELGCGWGSLTLWMAERYPQAEIVAVSNSRTQRAHIEAEARARGLGNVTVHTADMNDFAPSFHPEAPFDRIVSIEMFEHMRNWRRLLGHAADWLVPGGAIFLHVFCHRELLYPYEASRPGDWMARYFFTGGLMPSADLLALTAPTELSVEQQWMVDGRHYQRTAEAWLANMDDHRETVMPLVSATYGEAQARRWWTYWRVFFLACAELFGYRGGSEWQVTHVRLRRR